MPRKLTICFTARACFLRPPMRRTLARRTTQLRRSGSESRHTVFIFIFLFFPIQRLRHPPRPPAALFSIPSLSCHDLSSRVRVTPSASLSFSRSSVAVMPSALLICVLDLLVVLLLGGDRVGEAKGGFALHAGTSIPAIFFPSRATVSCMWVVRAWSETLWSWRRVCCLRRKHLGTWELFCQCRMCLHISCTYS
ncbi:hypothetical protein C8J57DRAFT_492932 [Mycena rebaudengoi]|nr:hypothetical protein C8J57DRAFT_492932 [Mycena rebaudengoi]